jgi:hypothetical protein
VRVGHTQKVSGAQPHPDVAAYGSLASALLAKAAELALEIGEVTEEAGRDRLYNARVASKTPFRDELSMTTVRAGNVMGLWLIGGWSQGIELITGITDDLGEVVRAARLWGDGTSVRDIERQVPFVRLPRLALAAEEGPERIVTEQWRHIHEQAQKMDWPERKLLIEAAYKEPKLRQLYPYISHYSLRFSTTTGQPLSPDCVVVDAVPGEPYVVSPDWLEGPDLGEAATAEEAVALAVCYLPDDLGPAVAGSYPWPDGQRPYAED